MKIILTLSMRNEIDFIKIQLDNALGLDLYDLIIVLDDASDDGSFDVVQEYARKYNNIEVHRNEHNSILNFTENRWFTLYKHAAKHEPTWIAHRAVDVIYPLKSKEVLKAQIERFYEIGVRMITFPFVNLWRSRTWYRNDREWAAWAIACDTNMYQYNKGAVWRNVSSGVHLGSSRPSDLGFGRKALNSGINSGLQINENDANTFPIVGLHLAHTTHENMVKRFDWYMRAAHAKNALGLPASNLMPAPADWHMFNTYKSYYEIGIQFKRGPDMWFDDPVPIEPDPPKIQSFYDMILTYNKIRAEEYKILFENHYGNN